MKRALAAVMVLIVLGGCSTPADLQAAKAYIPAFHQRLNAGQADAIYAQASDELKRTTTEVAFVAFLGAVNRRLGPAGGSRITGSNVTVATSGTLIALGAATPFARDPAATENFTFKVEGGEPKLAGYHVNSNALVMN